jgi:uncharacterized membrane protein YidH (DUF202 family)
MDKKYLLGLVFSLSIAFVSAFSIDNTRIESSGLNTNITINETIYADVLDVQDTYIYFQNLRTYTGTEYLNYSLNITDTDTLLVYNSSRKDLPYISSSSTTQKIITSTIAVNGSAIVNINCANTKRITHNGIDITYTCSNNVARLSLSIPSGASTIQTYAIIATDKVKSDIVYSGVQAGFDSMKMSFIICGIIFVVFIVGLFISLSKKPSMELVQEKSGEAVGLIIAIVIVVMMLLLMMILLGGKMSLFLA